MFEPKPSQDSVARYGEEAARSFAKIRQVQSDLSDAFDLLAKKSNSVFDAGVAASSFEYLWDLVSVQHQVLLASTEERNSRGSQA